MHKTAGFLLALTFFILTAAPGSATAAGEEATQREANLGWVFTGRDAAFVLMNPGTGRLLHYDEKLSATRFSPCSTFKIAHTVIALETGVVDGAGFRLVWDMDRYPAEKGWPEAWKRDQTLATAFRQSVVWCYREIAGKIGPERMAQWLEKLEYGNRDLKSGIDGFWLSGGSLKISPDEQVAFLRRLLEGELPVKPENVALVREMMYLESGADWKLYGKTGAGPLKPGKPEGPWLGWLVGFLEKPDGLWYYATFLKGEPFSRLAPQRKGLTRAALVHLGLIEP